MKLIGEAKHTEKKSKFLAGFYKIRDEQEAQRIVDDLKSDHKKANHVCWAAIVDGREMIKNDGEVGNPANTMLEILRSKNCQQHMIAVVRYFGGVKLGPGGVKRAFKKAALQATS